MSTAYSATAGMASDARLAVGYSYAENVATGMRSVFQSANFQAEGFPQMDSPPRSWRSANWACWARRGSGAHLCACKNPVARMR